MDNGTPSEREYQECLALLLVGLIVTMTKLHELGDVPTDDENDLFYRCFKACDALGIERPTTQ